MNQRWKQKILLLWLGQSVSLLTSAILQMSIIWHITTTTGSAVMLTLSTLSAFLPQALLGVFTGPFVDRISKKVVLVTADGAVAVTSLILGYLAIKGDLPMPVILGILAVRSLCTAFHEPAAQALTPLIVPADSLTAYAGYAQAFDSICYLLSPALSILLYNAFDISLVCWLDALGAALAISIVILVPFHHRPLATDATAKVTPQSLWDDLKSGLQFLRHQEGIVPLLVVGMVYSFIYSPIGSLYPHTTMIYFGGSTTASGIVETIFSTGTLLGSLLLGRWAQKLPKLWGLIGSIGMYGALVLVIGLLPRSGLPIFAVLSFFLGITTPFYHGITRAIYQLSIPQDYLGRTFALSQSSKRLGMPIGLLCGGVLADTIGSNVLLITGGSLALILAFTLTQTKSLRRFKAV